MFDSNDKEDPLKQYLRALTSDSVTSKQANAESLLKNAEQMGLNGLLEKQSNNKKDSESSISHQQTSSDTLDIQARLDDEFFALLLEIDGIKVAMPLAELGGIHTLDNMSKLPSKSKINMGLLYKNTGRFTCIDLAKVILPDRFPDNASSSLDYKFAVQLDHTGYVVACESACETTIIHKSDVKWRDEKTKHAWKAGTVLSSMYVLADVKGLIETIEALPN